MFVTQMRYAFSNANKLSNTVASTDFVLEKKFATLKNRQKL